MGEETAPTGAPPSDLADAARFLFGTRLPLAVEYARLLATDAVVRGLIGPHEVPRLWDRHLLNCAAIEELVPLGASVVDVGTGAGLPGLVLAVARPDLAVSLIEPLERRTAFLSETIASLGLDTVTVIRARAENCVGQLSPADIVTARAVAPLDRLARWCLPLAAVGGKVLALKGATAVDEIEAHRATVAELGGDQLTLRECGRAYLAHPTTVIEIVRERIVDTRPPRRTRARSASSRRSGRGRADRGGGSDAQGPPRS